MRSSPSVAVERDMTTINRKAELNITKDELHVIIRHAFSQAVAKLASVHHSHRSSGKREDIDGRPAHERGSARPRSRDSATQTREGNRQRHFRMSLMNIQNWISANWGSRGFHNAPPADDAACRTLWLSVIRRLLEDACGNTSPELLIDQERIKANAREYFRADNIDFRIVCLCAGLEPDHTLAFAKKAIADSDAAIKAGRRYKLPTLESLFGKPVAPVEDEEEEANEFMSEQIAYFK